jgi:hypothetical protein
VFEAREVVRAVDLRAHHERIVWVMHAFPSSEDVTRDELSVVGKVFDVCDVPGQEHPHLALGLRRHLNCIPDVASAVSTSEVYIFTCLSTEGSVSLMNVIKNTCTWHCILTHTNSVHDNVDVTVVSASTPGVEVRSSGMGERWRWWWC